MHLPTHFLMSWSIANIPTLERRDRIIISLAGIVPDIDAAGGAVEIFTRNSENPLMWFAEYHHTLCHNITFAFFVLAASFAAAKRRVMTALVAFGAFHLHLLGDIIGARGPDGSQWPVPYLMPFSESPSLAWSHQWALNGWQNITITIVLVILTFYLGWKHGRSFLEVISLRLDAGFVKALRQRFGEPKGGA